MNHVQITAEINALKNLLEQSDHVPNKFFEKIVLALDGATVVNTIPLLLSAVMSGLDEYRDVVKNRVALRTRINELEVELDKMPEDEIS